MPRRNWSVARANAGSTVSSRTTAMRSPDTASPARDRPRGRLERLKSRLLLNQYSKRKWSGFQWGERKGTCKTAC